jgi:hypothetical protein
VIHEEIGVTIINSYAVRSVAINSEGESFTPQPAFLMEDLFLLNSAEDMREVEIDENALPIVGFSL